jgi:hypothetical protein
VKTIIAILVMVCLASCEVIEVFRYHPEVKLSFDIEQSNSDNDFTATVEKVLQTDIRSDWRLYYNSTDSVTLIREVACKVLLSNGDSLDLGFWFIRYEESYLVNLVNDTLTGKYWRYKDIDIASGNFFHGFKEARVLVNNNVIFYENTNEEFRILKVKDILIGGEQKSYIELYFQGNAYGWYDPSGEYQEVYSITNGNLSGVVD